MYVCVYLHVVCVFCVCVCAHAHISMIVCMCESVHSIQTQIVCYVHYDCHYDRIQPLDLTAFGESHHVFLLL